MGDIKLNKTIFSNSILFLNFFKDFKNMDIGDFIYSKKYSQGIIGQNETRKALFMMINLINNDDFESRGIFLTGPSSTGKTTLISASSRLLNPNLPFIKINGTEFHNPILPKIEVLNQAARKSIGLTFFQEIIVIEGELVKIIEKKETKSFKLVLKNKNFQGIYRIGPKFLKKIAETKIEKGDRVSIDKASGEIYSICKKKDLNFLEKEIQEKKNHKRCVLEKVKIVEHFITLHEIDSLNSVEKKISSILVGMSCEINGKKREKVDGILENWRKKGKIKLLKGILFIDDIHMLDNNCFSFLGKIIENKFSPNFIFATNCVKKKINGLKYRAPHGIPVDFLDRFLVLSTGPFSNLEIKQILEIKLKSFGNEIEDKCKLFLLRLTIECGLGYVLNILPMISIGKKEKILIIDLAKIKNCYKLFMDFKKFVRNTNFPKYFLYRNKF